MDYLFSHHYSIEEARALLPQLREWLEQLVFSRNRLKTYDQKIQHLLSNGADILLLLEP